MHTEQAHFLRRQGHYIEFDLGDKSQRAFRTRDQFTEIEIFLASRKGSGLQRRREAVAALTAMSAVMGKGRRE